MQQGISDASKLKRSNAMAVCFFVTPNIALM